MEHVRGWLSISKNHFSIFLTHQGDIKQVNLIRARRAQLGPAAKGREKSQILNARFIFLIVELIFN